MSGDTTTSAVAHAGPAVPAALRDRRIAGHAHLITSAVRRFSRRWTDADDLASAGMLGLVAAASRYPGEAAYFAPYAAKYVNGYVRAAMAGAASVLHVPPKTYGRLRRARRSPAVTPLAARYEADAGRALAVALRSGWRRPLPRMLGHGASPARRLAAPLASDPLEAADLAGSLLEALDARERAVIILRFGLGGEPERDGPAIARALGISGGWVRRILAGALVKMRARALAIDPDATLAMVGGVRTDGTVKIAGNDDVVRMVADRLGRGESVAGVARELGISTASVRKARGIAGERGWLT